MVSIALVLSLFVLAIFSSAIVHTRIFLKSRQQIDTPTGDLVDRA
ncbi:hypothetical protein V2H45_15695 [Tumidithrix elongata RA019]|uniref:Uncharacterized protein n=1 Tax=Tumidithrix elongata BACA0141 TaxID=2716417 RepID=A0AAW9Q2U1_9CYAN|nr:hypothetical protein [Tumidithrix elongata RA019]